MLFKHIRTCTSIQNTMLDDTVMSQYLDSTFYSQTKLTT